MKINPLRDWVSKIQCRELQFVILLVLALIITLLSWYFLVTYVYPDLLNASASLSPEWQEALNGTKWTLMGGI